MAWADPDSDDDAAWVAAVMRTVVEATMGRGPHTMVIADEVIRALGGDPEDFEEVMPGVRVLHGATDG